MLKIENSATKFEVKKVNDKKMRFMAKRVKALLVQHDFHKTLQGKSAKHVGTSDENCKKMNLKAASTI